MVAEQAVETMCREFRCNVHIICAGMYSCVSSASLY